MFHYTLSMKSMLATRGQYSKFGIEQIFTNHAIVWFHLIGSEQTVREIVVRQNNTSFLFTYIYINMLRKKVHVGRKRTKQNIKKEF